jgi:hypothetical protein
MDKDTQVLLAFCQEQWTRFQQIRLHYLWLVFHLAIAAMGFILTILILIQI